MSGSERRQQQGRQGFRDHRYEMLDGHELVKPLPRDAPPALARPGMAVADYGSGDVGVIVAMTTGLCFYRTDDGALCSALWPSICLPHVEPEKRRVLRDRARIERLRAQVEREAGD